MPRERFYNLPAAARGKLLDLALREFAEKGLEEASLNEILAKAGLSKGAYYYYFDDKEDLLATAIDVVLDGMLAQLPLPAFKTLRREEFWPAVESCAGLWRERFDSMKILLRVLPYIGEERRRSSRFTPILAKAHAFWRTIIEAGQRLGCVRTDIPNDLLVRLVEANDAVLDASFLALHAKVTRDAFDDHMRLVLDTMRRILAVENPAPRARSARRRRARGHG